MLPDPLHPAVVHLPIALAVLLPLLALGALLAIRGGWLPARAWTGVVLLQLLLVGSSWLAVETGEREEERVEKVVAGSHIESHEEGAETFLAVTAVAALASCAGLLAGRAGALGRLATLAAGGVVLAAGISVGHSGGELVYRHGAASAYAEKAEAGLPSRGSDAPERTAEE
jgi:uncharacterized membrane protein